MAGLLRETAERHCCEDCRFLLPHDKPGADSFYYTMNGPECKMRVGVHNLKSWPFRATKCRQFEPPAPEVSE